MVWTWRLLVTASLAALLALGAFASRAAADPVAEAAARAKAAREAGEQEALAALANGAQPDAWILLESLLAGGDAETAAALAAARKGSDRTAMARYVTWRGEHPVPPEVSGALAALPTAHDPQAFLTRIAPLLKEGRGVSHVLLAGVRVHMLFRLGRPVEELAAAMQVEAAGADAIGWLDRAYAVYRAVFERYFLLPGAERVIELGRTVVRIADSKGDAASRSDARMCLARALEAGGRADEALPVAREAVELAPSTLLRRNGTRLVVVMHMVLGDRHAALRALGELHTLDKALGDAHGAKSTEMHIASYEAKLGHSAKAVARIEALIEYFEANGSNMSQRGVHMQAASIWRELRDPQRSIEHIRLARAAEARAREAGEPSKVSPHQLDAIEALDLVELGRYDEAAPVFRRIVEGRTKTTRATRLFDHMSLGATLARQGKHEEAARIYAAGAALLSEELSSDIRAKWHQSRADALLRAGELDAARTEALEARRVSEEGLLNEFQGTSAGVLAQIAYASGDMPATVTYAEEMLSLAVKRSASLPERSGALFRAELDDIARVAVEAAAQGGDAARLFHLAERLGAVALRGRLEPGDVLDGALTPALRDRERELQEAEAHAVGVYRRAKTGDARRAARKALGTVREDLDRHRERMHAEQAAAAYVIEPVADTLAVTQARLTSGETLVLYLLGEAHAWALVSDATKARIVELAPRAELEALLREVVPEDPTAGAKDVARLTKALVAPLGLKATGQALTVVPTGAFAFVPYAALLPKRVVTLQPSATAGRLLTERPCCGEGTLAVGDPESRDGRRLPGGRKEAEAVGDVTLIGAKATEKALRTTLASRKRWRALHLACHGLIDPVHPLRSALSLTPAGDDDGLWTVSELLTTDVAADVAVLGSCSTGRGKAYDQDGVLGFVHAFFVAGVRHVLVSLWDVDDAAASALLQRFHREWTPEVDPATALARAQAWMRAQPRWTAPTHWAAWQIWGPAR